MVNMGTGGFGTTTEVMNSTAQQIEQVSQTVNSQLNNLMGQLEPLQSQWRGAAASAFQQLMARWKEDATKLTTALDQISQMMSQSSKAYQQSEDTNQSAISNILGTLN
jgi:WXG100 family type VII secretion target